MYSVFSAALYYCNQLTIRNERRNSDCSLSIQWIPLTIIGFQSLQYFFLLKGSWSLSLLAVVFLFLPAFTLVLPLVRLGSLRTAGFSVRSKHFSRRSTSLSGRVKMYWQGTSIPNPPPWFTAFPHILTILLVLGFARKCHKSPTPSFVLGTLNGTCPTTR